MQFQLKYFRKKDLFFTILLVISLFSLVMTYSEKLSSMYKLTSAILAIFSSGYLANQNRSGDTVDKINGAKPLWEFLKVNSEIEYFSLDKNNSHLDKVRYYSLIVDGNDNIKSINKLNDKYKLKKKYSSELNANNEILNFYFSPNAVVESDKQYNIKDEFFNKSKNKAPVFKTLSKKQEDKNYRLINIIKATTMYDNITYFFEGDGLSGGLTLIGKKYKPYSGNWGSWCTKRKNIKTAKDYLKQLGIK